MVIPPEQKQLTPEEKMFDLIDLIIRLEGNIE